MHDVEFWLSQGSWRWRVAATLAITFSTGCYSTALALPSPQTSFAFSFGANFPGITGQDTTNGFTTIATPINTSNLAGKSIIDVAPADHHSLALTSDGTVFAFGSNTLGATGLGTTVGNTLVATPINTANLSGKVISQITAGTDHSVLLANDGSVFSFGFNGAGDTGLNTNVGNTLVATPIDATNLAGKKITQISTGLDHSLLLADDGSVFTFGSNRYGQTGLGTANGETLIATQIDMTNIGSKKIIQVSADYDHSLLLADDGTVFSFGYNRNGLTGQGTAVGTTLIATEIDATNIGGYKISQVAAGREHSLLLDDNGTVYSFGVNGYGETGLGTTAGSALIATPIVTSNLGGEKITSISAGEFYSLLLAADGTVFSFGDNGNYKTGLGTGAGSALVAVPIVATNLNGFHVSRIAAGRFHSLLVASVPEPSVVTLLLSTLPFLLTPYRSAMTRLRQARFIS
jgi:alpha-tubulin suppressor-like RCC1 family protein